MNAAVSLQNVTRKFGDFVAVDNVSFEVHKGEIFGFLGPNGSGKTTTIKMICGILAPTAGNLRVLEYDAVRQRRKMVHQIGYMSQKFSLYPSLTVEENLKFYAGVYGIRGAQRSKRISDLLEEHGLTALRGRIVRDLPLGWKQRVALASALVHGPSIVFLDEPTGGVDPSSRRMFWDNIVEMAHSGVTIFVTTHYMDEAEYCDRIGLIHRGSIIALGATDELKRKAIRGRVFEVALPDAISHMEKIGAYQSIDEVTMHGRNLHVIVNQNVTDTGAVFQDLKNSGVPIESCREIPPSLEDVFVTLLR